MTKEEIKTMPKEERKRQLEWSDPYEFGTIYAEYLLEEKQEIINYLNKKCKKEKGRTDFDIFMNLNEQLKTLEHFAEKIDYNLHPIITNAYKCEIRNCINDLCKTLRYEVVYKDDIKEILSKIEKR